MITGLFSMTACGPACWEARDDVCKCSCGGRNHGVHRHRVPGTAGLKRQKIYSGFIFEFDRVSPPEDRGSGQYGPDVVALDRYCQELNTKAGVRHLYAHTTRNHYGEFPIAIMRQATDAEINKWPELAEWRGKVNGIYGKPYVVWLRRDDLTQQVQANLNQKAA